MKRTLDVNTGEVRIGTGNTILRSSSIGTCIVIAACDIERGVGGMAHIMVPGRCAHPEDPERTRYSEDGIERLLEFMSDEGSEPGSIQACIVGGGNVLRRENDTVGDENISSVIDILTRSNIPILKRSVGGFERRTILFDLTDGSVRITVGDGPTSILHTFTHDHEPGEMDNDR